MLVLSRTEGQKVMIGDDVIVTVILIERGKIRLGIQAPKNKQIYREELLTDEQRKTIVEKAK